MLSKIFLYVNIVINKAVVKSFFRSSGYEEGHQAVLDKELYAMI